MATRMTKTNTVTENTEDVKKKIKTFDNEDLIPCKSITNGELLMHGVKSGILYRWADYGDVEDVEYQDLVYEIRSARSQYVMSPRFIILDDDIVVQNKKLKEIYDSLYTKSDLRDFIMNASVSEINNIVPTFPSGVKDSLRGLVATMITSGQLDSVVKIKAFDTLFGTEMLQVLIDN